MVGEISKAVPTPVRFFFPEIYTTNTLDCGQSNDSLNAVLVMFSSKVLRGYDEVRT